MPLKKKAKQAEPDSKTRKPSAKSGATKVGLSSSAGDASNAQKGLLSLPTELIAKVLASFKTIGNFTSLPELTAEGSYGSDVKGEGASENLLAGEPVLGREYLERPDALRALSQTCVAYREVFLPLLFERLEVCVNTRPGNPTKAFYKHIGDGLERKCSGLAGRPDLWEMVRFVRFLTS